MISATQRLMALTVNDIMSENVVSAECPQSMTRAAELMVTHEVSGIPVVDEAGRCVGILSAMDFVKREHHLGSINKDTLLGMEAYELTENSCDGPHCLGVMGDLVSRHMSRGVQTISPEVSLLQAARVMCAQHVHRLPVVDEAGHVVGMITSMDLVSALVGAVDEMRQASE